MKIKLTKREIKLLLQALTMHYGERLQSDPKSAIDTAEDKLNAALTLLS